jgi:chromosomal replication initiator protein
METGGDSAARAWSAIAARLEIDLSDAAFQTWFAAAVPSALSPDELSVLVPNDFTRAWIEGNLIDRVASAAREVLPEGVDVRFSVGENAASFAAAERRDVAERDPQRSSTHPVAAKSPPQVREGLLLPKYTFDDFVIGPSNRFAHAAALAVAEAPGQAYNPLFIHGPTGLGKTHLLQAIGRYVGEQLPELRIHYVKCESFTNEFVEHLQRKSIDRFKARYRSYDLLLIDDIQFLAGKQSTQEEFFHTFNSLYEAGGQLVLSSDRPPKEIGTLEERLRSRFEWGLITDVQPPDLETRTAILRTRAFREGAVLRDPSVLEEIAQRVSTNIRELEGALTRVLAYASLNGEPIDHELVREVLRGQFGEPARLITIEDVQRAVADAFHMAVADLRSSSRAQQVVRPRQLAMYLCRELTDASLPKIGVRFGNRDHSTVHYAVTKIGRQMKTDRQVLNLVQDLSAQIRAS